MELHYVQFCMRRRRTVYLIHSKDKVLGGILKIFLFFKFLIGLSRAAIDLFQWDAPSDDVDDGRTNSQVDFRSYWVLNHQFDGHLSLLITVPIQTLGSSTFFVNHPHFLWNDIALEKSPPKPPKKWLRSLNFFWVAWNMLTIIYLQKTRSNLGYCGLRNAISENDTPIGGSHPMLYFPIQTTQKYSIVLC